MVKKMIPHMMKMKNPVTLSIIAKFTGIMPAFNNLHCGKLSPAMEIINPLF